MDEGGQFTRRPGFNALQVPGVCFFKIYLNDLNSACCEWNQGTKRVVIMSALFVVLEVSTLMHQVSLSRSTNATSSIDITPEHFVTLARTILSCTLPKFRRNKTRGMSDVQLSTLFVIWAVTVPFCKVLVRSTETLVTDNGLSRYFIGGVIWPVITNLPILVIVMAHNTPLGAVQALRYNTAPVYTLHAVYKFLDENLLFLSWVHFQLDIGSVMEHTLLLLLENETRRCILRNTPWKIIYPVD